MPSERFESARAIWEVTAGLIPGQADAKHTRQFGITSRDWAAHMQTDLLLERWHQAVAYATFLQLMCAQGLEVNWVRIEFVWP